MKITVNINEYVYVSLTAAAKKVLRDKGHLFVESATVHQFQLWELMSLFGERLFNGCDQLFHENTIEFRGSPL